MKPPFRYYGAKMRMADTIVQHFPPEYDCYVEPFGGSAAVLLAKPPEGVEVYNDIDEGLVNFYRVLQDPEKREELLRRLSVTPYSRAEYEHCHETWEDCDDPIEKARRWYVAINQAFSGIYGGSWSYSITDTSKGMSKNNAAWITRINRIVPAANRMMRVQIECLDWAECMEKYDTEETFFYLDPPYPKDIREKGYRVEGMSIPEHQKLVDMMLSMQGKALLSGYDHSVYRGLDRENWSVSEWKTRTSATNSNTAHEGRAERTELLWYNYELPDAKQASIFDV